MSSNYAWEKSDSGKNTYLLYNSDSYTGWHIKYENRTWTVYNGVIPYGRIKGKENTEKAVLSIISYIDFLERMYNIDGKTLNSKEKNLKDRLRDAQKGIPKEIMAVIEKNFRKNLLASQGGQKLTEILKVDANIITETTLEEKNEETAPEPKRKVGRPKSGRKYWRVWANEEEHEAIKELLKKLRTPKDKNIKKEVEGQMSFDFKKGGAK